MGLLSEIYLAPTGRAAEVTADARPERCLAGIDSSGIDSVKLATLHSLLTGQDFESLLPSYEPTAVAGEDGPWLFRLPDDLTRTLADLSPDQRRDIAARWAAEEGFILDGWKSQAVHDAFEAIYELAVRADQSTALYLWMSL